MKLEGTSPEEIAAWLENQPRTNEGENVTSPQIAARVIREHLDKAPEEPDALWRGKPIKLMDRNELIEALCDLGRLYNRRRT